MMLRIGIDWHVLRQIQIHIWFFLSGSSSPCFRSTRGMQWLDFEAQVAPEIYRMELAHTNSPSCRLAAGN